MVLSQMFCVRLYEITSACHISMCFAVTGSQGSHLNPPQTSTNTREGNKVTHVSLPSHAAVINALLHVQIRAIDKSKAVQHQCSPSLMFCLEEISAAPFQILLNARCFRNDTFRTHSAELCLTRSHNWISESFPENN